MKINWSQISGSRTGCANGLGLAGQAEFHLSKIEKIPVEELSADTKTLLATTNTLLSASIKALPELTKNAESA